MRCPDTGLPLPAESEASAFEGWLYPDRARPEGPFGELGTGCYSGWGVKPGADRRGDRAFPPQRSRYQPRRPAGQAAVRLLLYVRSVMKSAMATDALASAGLPWVSAVWCHEAGGGRAIIVVGLEQALRRAQQAGGVPGRPAPR